MKHTENYALPQIELDDYYDIDVFNDGYRKIDEELKNVNESLDNKTTCFESVKDMKESNTLKNNTVCKTLGYYKYNDGGGATYLITNNTPLENGFSFSLNNGLTAELIYGDEVNIKQLGARSFDDNGEKVDIIKYIQMYLLKSSAHENNANNKEMLKLYIPSGRWFTSPYKFTCSSIYIHGNNNYSYPYVTGTIIAPIEENQTHMWIFGDDTQELVGREYGNIALKSLMFTTYNFNEDTGIPLGGATYDKCYNVGKILGIYRIYGGVFENIHFTNYLGCPLTIASSNESIFNDFTFRNGDSFEDGQVVFDGDVMNGTSFSKNISACFFDKFSFEGVKGHLFNFKTNSKYINNHIGTVLFEDRSVKISKNGTFRDYDSSSDENKTFISKAIFNIEENDYCELNVDNVYLNNFGRSVFTLNESEYLFDSIVNKESKISKGGVNIKNISHVGARRDTLLLNEHDFEGLGSTNFLFTCENANNVDVTTRKFVVKTNGGTKPNIRYNNTLYNRCVDYVLYSSTLLNKNGKYGYYMPIVTDNNSLTNEKLVVNGFQYKNYVTSYSSETSSVKIPVIGNKLRIRIHTKYGFLAQCRLNSNTSIYQNRTVKDSENMYKWYTLDFTDFRTTHTDEEMHVVIRVLTDNADNYAKLDVFYWI